MIDLIFCGIALLIFLVWRLLGEGRKKFKKIEGMLEDCNDDIYDIKKHLNLPTEVRTKLQQCNAIFSYVDFLVSNGKTLTEVLESLKKVNKCGYFQIDSKLVDIKKFEIGELDLDCLKESISGMMDSRLALEKITKEFKDECEKK